MTYLFVLVLFLSSIVLRAQPPVEEPGLRCKFLCFEKVPGLQEPYAKGPGGSPLVKVSLPTISGSPSVQLFVEDGKIIFHKTAEGGGQPVAVASIPNGTQEVLILFFPNPAPADQETSAPLLRTIVLDMGSNDFPPGGSVVLNSNTTGIRFILGEHQLLLSPGKITTVPRPQKRDKFNMSLTTFQSQNGDKWQTIHETMEHFPPAQRKLYVVYIDSKLHRPRARSYNL